MDWKQLVGGLAVLGSSLTLALTDHPVAAFLYGMFGVLALGALSE